MVSQARARLALRQRRTGRLLHSPMRGDAEQPGSGLEYPYTTPRSHAGQILLIGVKTAHADAYWRANWLAVIIPGSAS